MRPPGHPNSCPKVAARLMLVRKGEETTQLLMGTQDFSDEQHVTKRGQKGCQARSPRHSVMFQVPHPLLHTDLKEPARPDTPRAHPRGPTKPGAHRGDGESKGSQVQATGHSHFHI